MASRKPAGLAGPEPARHSPVRVDLDEGHDKATPEKIPTLKAPIVKDCIITAANSLTILDGAAALPITKASITRGATELRAT